LALEGSGPGLQVLPEGREVGLLLLDGHLLKGHVLLSIVEGGLLIVNRLCHGLGSVDGVTSRLLLSTSFSFRATALSWEMTDVTFQVFRS
jgi:hypothetical protein